MQLTKNIITLYIFQASVYIVPLITTPYLSRTLGVEQFGVLGMATSIVAFVTLVTDWGFILSATRQAARHASNPEQLRRLLWNIFVAKVFLGLTSLVVFVFVVMISPPLREISPVLFVCSLQVFANFFSAGWFLQGLERMVSFSIVSMVGRLLMIPLIFLLVHSPADTVIVAALQSTAALISAGASLFVAARIVNIWPAHIDFAGAWHAIKDGSRLFVSTGAISLYVQSNVVVVGLVSGPVQAGFFHGAERVQRAVQGLIGPLSSAVYPRVNSLLVADPSRALRLMVMLFFGQGATALILSLAMLAGASFITPLFLGREFVDAVPVVQWLAAIPFIVGLSNVFGTNILIPLGMQNAVMIITIISALLNLVLIIPLSHYNGGAGAAMAVVITETFVTTSMAVVIYWNREELAALGRKQAVR